MRAVFLRGAVPPAHENPEKLLYSSMEECNDLWTQLFYYLLKGSGSTGELLYNGPSREFLLDETFSERWVDMGTYTPEAEPDLIICRGGFPYYDKFVTRFPNAKKIYYGAGKRYWPETSFTDYDLFLTDSRSQCESVLRKGKMAAMLLKPAATMFKPVAVPKEYDVCFMANASQHVIKRHDLFIRSMAGSGLRILSLGNTDPYLMQLARQVDANITWGGWHHRKHLPEWISKCKVGVCCSNNVDSCPRVIPEYMACGLPVVVTDNVNFWSDHYIQENTGVLTPQNQILKGVKEVLENLDSYNAAEHYQSQSSMKVAAKRLCLQIKGCC